MESRATDQRGTVSIWKHKIVLVVEDDADAQLALEELLTDDGYRVLVASNGREALNVLEHVRPNLILLDLMMPVMSGWEVMAAIATDPLLNDIPVVVLSAYIDQAPHGVACTMSKPISAHDLRAAISRHCE
jgi:CheY-like chemotaxis protein